MFFGNKITSEDIEFMKENKGYLEILDKLLIGDYVNALVLSVNYGIEIPEEIEIKAADEIAGKCYDDPFGLGNCLKKEHRISALSVYDKHDLNIKAEELRIYFNQKSGLSIR